MGEVFLAEDTRLRRKVALKVLPENIAPGDTHFLASEFVTGGTLRERLDKGNLTVSETLEIAL